MNKKFYLFLGITILFCFLAKNVKFSSSSKSAIEIYSVEFNYHGVDCNKIESQITEPLEKLLQELPDLKKIQSNVEYSKSTTTLYFEKSKLNKYPLISELAFKFHNQLPTDVPKPIIYSSSQDDSPIFKLAILSDKNQELLFNWLEYNIKPKLQKLNGVSLVKILGQEQSEFIINFDSQLACINQTDPNQIANIVKLSTSPDIFFDKFIIKSKPENLDKLKQINTTPGIKLEDLCEIYEKEKSNDTITKLNSKDCLIINIYSETNANIIAISNKIKKIINQSKLKQLKTFIILDKGKEIQKSLTKILFSLLEAILFITILIPFFFRSKKLSLLIVAALIFSSVWSLGIFSLFKISLNEKSILGLTLSLGLISDFCLLIIELFVNSTTEINFKSKIKKEIPALIISLLTSILCLIPLLLFDHIIPGAKDLGLPIIIMLFSSTIISVIFLPEFIIFFNKENKIKNQLAPTNHGPTNLAPTTPFLKSKINLSPKVFYFLQPITILLLIIIPKSLTSQNNQNYIFCQVEFESNRKALSIEQDIEHFCQTLLNEQTVKYIQTDISNGKALIYIIPQKIKNIKTIKKIVQENKSLIFSGTLFTEGLSKPNYNYSNFKIGITGPSLQKCQSLIINNLKILQENNCQVVLNFKDGGSKLIFTPDKELAIKNNFTSQQIAVNANWSLFGPVIAKFITNGKEKDIRIKSKTKENISQNDLENIFVPVNQSTIQLFSLGKIGLKENQLSLLRHNCKPVAYLTVTKKGRNIIKNINQTKKLLESQPLEEGYSYIFPEELKETNKQFLLLYATLFLSIVLIFILIAALTENLKNSFLSTSIIFPSIFLPVLLRFIFGAGIELGDFIGLLLLGGITVNNSIFILSSQNYWEKFNSITTSTLTTLASSLPLMFNTANQFSCRFSFTMFFGILGSWIISLYVFPKVIKKPAQSEPVLS